MSDKTKFIIEIAVMAILVIAALIVFVLKPSFGQTSAEGAGVSVLDVETEEALDAAQTKKVVPTPEPTAQNNPYSGTVLPTPPSVEGYSYQDVEMWTAEQLGPYLSQVVVPDDFRAAMISSGILSDGDPWFWQKLYMQTHGDIQIAEFGNPYYENEGYLEEMEYSLLDDKLSYTNKKIRETYGDNGEYIEIGVDEASAGYGICLNAYASVSETGRRIGFYYMPSDPGNVVYEIGTFEPSRPSSASSNGYHNYIITNITYDTAIPSLIDSNTDTGIWWRGVTEDDVYIRMIDLDTNEVLGIFCTAIRQDHDGAFIVASVSDNEITGSMNNKELRDLAQMASEVISTDDVSHNMDDIRDRMTVEKLPKPFFNILLSTNGNQTISRSSITESVVYSVHFISAGNGYTVYFASLGETVDDDGNATETFYPICYEIPTVQTREWYNSLVRWDD